MKKILLFISFICLPLIAENESRLHTRGTGKVFIKTERADIRLGIELEGKTSNGVQDELAKNYNKLVEALKKASPLKLETSSYTVYPEYTDHAPRQIKSYRGVGEITVTIPSEQSGSLIALAMESGATKVNGIELKASKEALAEANKRAIQEACDNAMLSAKVILESLQLEMDAIVDVSLNPLEISPRPFRSAAMFNAMAKESSGPNLEGEEAVQAEISLELRFKPR